MCIIYRSCHYEEMAPAGGSRWLHQGGQRIPESQHNHCGHWRRSTGIIIVFFHHISCFLGSAENDRGNYWSWLQMENRQVSAEQDDIESNLLIPSGVIMRIATLSLKVYRAEDMPQSKWCIFNILWNIIWCLAILFGSGCCRCSDNEAILWRRSRQEKLGRSVLRSQLCREKGIFFRLQLLFFVQKSKFSSKLELYFLLVCRSALKKFRKMQIQNGIRSSISMSK